ncbi:MAG: hypothetical protein K9I94_03385 [Bacteroidales bacterium]|nr:hypothetical protein [Bacteroidales bacterium]
MKKLAIITLTAGLLFFTPFLTPTAQADGPAPPPPDHGTTGNTSGATAPIGGGLFILLGLGAGYGAKKIYDVKKKKAAEEK